MEISMTEQGIVFLFSCGVGAFLGVVYDVFRIFRIAFSPRWLAAFFQDILFCLISAVTVILLVYYTNSGVVRWFSMLGCLLCFILYYMTVGKAVIFLSEKIINFIKAVLRFIYGITIRPLKAVLKFLLKILKFLCGKAVSLFEKVKIRLVYGHEKRKFSHKAKKGFNLMNK